MFGSVCALFGGVDQKQQILLLKNGCEIVVSTPGRLVHFMRKKYFKSKRITYLVLDEADRMFDMGFEPQLRSIVGQIRPDRQTMLFSATFKKPGKILILYYFIFFLFHLFYFYLFDNIFYFFIIFFIL